MTMFQTNILYMILDLVNLVGQRTRWESPVVCYTEEHFVVDEQDTQAVTIRLLLPHLLLSSHLKQVLECLHLAFY